MKRQRTTTTVNIKNPKFKKARKSSLVNPPRSKVRTPERKNIDATSVAGIVAGSGTAVLTLLNGVDDGATATQRIGRKIDMTSFQFIFDINMATATTGASSIRNLVVFDKQANAAAPAVLDVVAVNTITSPMNLANSSRFIVISDKIYPGIGTAGPQSLIDKQYYKINLSTEFNTASTADITSITSGSIYLLQWQDGGLLTASPVNTYFSRIRFTDA